MVSPLLEDRVRLGVIQTSTVPGNGIPFFQRVGFWCYPVHGVVGVGLDDRQFTQVHEAVGAGAVLRGGLTWHVRNQRAVAATFVSDQTTGNIIPIVHVHERCQSIDVTVVGRLWSPATWPVGLVNPLCVATLLTQTDRSVDQVVRMTLSDTVQLHHAFLRVVRQLALGHVVSNVHQTHTSVTTRLSGQLHVRQGVVVVVDAVVDHVQSVVSRLGVLFFCLDVGRDQRSQCTEGNLRLLTLVVDCRHGVVSEGAFTTVLHPWLEFQSGNRTHHAFDFNRYVGVEEHVLILFGGELDVAQELGAVQFDQVIVVPGRLSDLNTQVGRQDRITVRRVIVDLVDQCQVEATGLEPFGTGVDDQLASGHKGLLERLVLFVLLVQANELVEVLAVHRRRQVRGTEDVEQEDLLIEGRLVQQEAVQHHGVIDATLTLVDRGPWVLQDHDLSDFRIERAEVLVQATATRTLLVRLDDTELLVVVRELTAVDHQTATDRFAQGTDTHVLAEAGRHVGHHFSDYRRSADGFLGVVTGEQAAREEAVVASAHVVVVRCRCRQTLVHQVGVDRLKASHPGDWVVVLTDDHGHTGQRVLTGLVDTASHTVTQSVLVTALLELVVGTVEVTLVVDQRFDVSVFFVRVVQVQQHASGLHDAVDFAQGAFLLAPEYFLMDVSCVDTSGHQLASPCVSVQCVTDQTVVEFLSSAALWHLSHGGDDNGLPVDVFGESSCSPLPPAESFGCVERFDVPVTFDELFDHWMMP
ncbi:hypothetical protein D3C81_783750 [compost metagenome]